MTDELEPVPPYDPEVEKRRIEAYEGVQKALQETQRAVHERWQGVAEKAIDALKEGMTRNKEIEARNFLWILVVIVAVVAGAGVLTWAKAIPGEAFALLVGTIVGYIVSLARPVGK